MIPLIIMIVLVIAYGVAIYREVKRYPETTKIPDDIYPPGLL